MHSFVVGDHNSVMKSLSYTTVLIYMYIYNNCHAFHWTASIYNYSLGIVSQPENLNGKVA